MSADITLLQALERVAAASPEQVTITLQVQPGELRQLAADAGVPVDTRILGTRLASDSLCLRRGWVRIILSAGYRKATAAELRAESKRLGLAAESTDAA